MANGGADATSVFTSSKARPGGCAAATACRGWLRQAQTASTSLPPWWPASAARRPRNRARCTEWSLPCRRSPGRGACAQRIWSRARRCLLRPDDYAALGPALADPAASRGHLDRQLRAGNRMRLRVRIRALCLVPVEFFGGWTTNLGIHRHRTAAFRISTPRTGDGQCSQHFINRSAATPPSATCKTGYGWCLRP